MVIYKMLSLETENILARLVYALLISEIEVERSRQSLSSSPDFDPYAAFDLLDRMGVKKISSASFRNFLSNNGYTFTMQQISLLISQYHPLSDFSVSQKDFLRLVLPSEDFQLRQVALRRGDNLSQMTQKQLADHLSLEINNQINLRALKESLQSRFDFSYDRAFRTLNPEGFYAIRSYQLETFLRRKGYFISLRDLDAIIRRIDTDGDEMFSFSEFKDFLSIRQEPKTGLRQSTPKTQSKTTLKKSVRSSIRRAKRTQSAKKRQGKRRMVRWALFKDEMIKGEIGEFFKVLVEIDRNVEISKQSLSRQADFTLLDFFRLIDLEEKGWISEHDLRGLFRDLGLFFEDYEPALLMKHFGNYSQIRLEDLGNMIKPQNDYYSSLLLSRSPLSFPPLNRTSAFSQFTVQCISEALATFIEGERRAERKRREISYKSYINGLEVFKEMDKDCDGFISREELERVLEVLGLRIDFRDVEALVDRMDKDRDGKISYSEFLEELSPKMY